MAILGKRLIGCIVIVTLLFTGTLLVLFSSHRSDTIAIKHHCFNATPITCPPRDNDTTTVEYRRASLFEWADHQALWRSQGKQDRIMYQRAFWSMTEPGVYVEFGARNGESESNTYFYEHALNWTGLLVEANPIEIPGIREKRPTALILEGGICSEHAKVEFAFTEQASGLSAQSKHHTNRCQRRYFFIHLTFPEHHS